MRASERFARLPLLAVISWTQCCCAAQPCHRLAPSGDLRRMAVGESPEGMEDCYYHTVI
jgi:hypothetical protein